MGATTVDAVTGAATACASALFAGQKARVGAEPSAEAELGARLETSDSALGYLIIGQRASLLHKYTLQDIRLLEALASITSSALDKAALHEQTTQQATQDPLTGLGNRRHFETQVGSALRGSSATVGIVFVDLDGFKQINDQHGHQAGDETLVEAARRLAGVTRERDAIARLGGDEFTILLAVCSRLRTRPSLHIASSCAWRSRSACRAASRCV